MTELLKEQIHKPWNVVRPALERGHFNAHHIDAVVEVFAKAAFLDCCGEVTIRRTDNAAVKLQQLFAAHPVELTRFNQPQQLCLQLSWQFRHLVQKQNAAAGTLGKTAMKAVAPVPLWPNSSFSMTPAGIAAQLTPMNGSFERCEMRCRNRAQTSFPTPVSPVMRSGRGTVADPPQHGFNITHGVRDAEDGFTHATSDCAGSGFAPVR